MAKPSQTGRPKTSDSETLPIPASWFACLTVLLAAGLPALPVASEPQPFHLSTAELQTALDRNGFGVGLIDDRPGPKTRAALADFGTAAGTAEPEALIALAGDDRSAAFQTYVVTTQDLAKVGTAPGDWVEASKAPRMACESLIEVLSEKFHSSEVFLARLNPEIPAWDAGAIGKAIRAPNVGRQRNLPDATRISIDCSQFRLRAYDGDNRLVASFPCSVARDLARAPTGSLQITTFAANPTYVFDPKNYPESARARETGRRLIIPAGPNSPVGDYWLGINAPGFGIHGTPHPETIGRQESHGCFRLTNWDIVRLSKIVKPGTPVAVTGL